MPSLWLDVLQKVKAAGLNAVSVYTHCKLYCSFVSRLPTYLDEGGLINPSPGVVDFNSFRALQPLYDAAKEAGIFIVLRPGILLINWDLYIYTE